VNGFKDKLKAFARAGGNAQKLVEETLQESSERVLIDTKLALSKSYLPAGGRYWTGTTSKSVVERADVSWKGLVAEVPVGFDFSEPGAGGYLITGTPRMKPDQMLNKIYKQRSYMNKMQRDMADKVMDEIVKIITEG
jgi:hypothetical protein